MQVSFVLPIDTLSPDWYIYSLPNWFSFIYNTIINTYIWLIWSIHVFNLRHNIFMFQTQEYTEESHRRKFTLFSSQHIEWNMFLYNTLIVICISLCRRNYIDDPHLSNLLAHKINQLDIEKSCYTTSFTNFCTVLQCVQCKFSSFAQEIHLYFSKGECIQKHNSKANNNHYHLIWKCVQSFKEQWTSICSITIR